MSSSIADAVGNGPLKRLLSLWCRESLAHGGIPPRSAFAPEILGPYLLPCMFVYERRREADGRVRFFCRVAGGNLRAAFRQEGTGRYLDELIPPDWLENRVRIFSRCIDGGLPLLMTGHLVAEGVEWRPYRRLLTPVRAQDGDVQLLGGIVFPRHGEEQGGRPCPPPGGKVLVTAATPEDIAALAAASPD